MAGSAPSLSAADAELLRSGATADPANQASMFAEQAARFPAPLELLGALLDRGVAFEHAGSRGPALVALCGGADAHELYLRDYRSRPCYAPARQAALEALIDRLLALGARVDARDDNGCSALWHALGWRSPAVVERLLAAGAPADDADSSGESLLLRALARSADEAEYCLFLLLEHGADPQRGKQESPLGRALRRGYGKCAKLLQQHGAKARGDDLVIAGRSGDAALLRRLLDSGVAADATDASGSTALSEAAGSGGQAAVDLLLRRGADPRHSNDLDTDALQRAAFAGDAELAERLRRAGVDPQRRNRYGQSAEDFALAGHQGELATQLRRPGRERPRADGWTRLMTAVGNACYYVDPAPVVATVRGLLTQGEDVNARHSEGDTALMVLLGSMSLTHVREHSPALDEVARLLLAHGADPRPRNRRGLSALDVAVRYGYRDIERQLRAALLQPQWQGAADVDP